MRHFGTRRLLFVLALALVFGLTLAGIFGGVERVKARLISGQAIISAPLSVIDDAPGATNGAQQAFDEQQDVLLGAPLPVDVGAVPAGIKVDSHMIFLNTIVGTPQTIDQGVVWGFDGPIVGVMSDNNGALEAASNVLLGAPGTVYPGGFNNRGLENNDGYVVAGNEITVDMTVTEPGDWIRVVTAAIPDLDHFKCYKTDGKPVRIIVGLVDQ